MIVNGHKIAPCARLRDADLRRADLFGADLYTADLRRADLFGANLRRADLYTADLTRANLRLADLSGANLTRANLTEANLFGADLTAADLTAANLAGADLRDGILFAADLRGADLRGANLFGADLTGTCLDPTNAPNVPTVADLRADGFEIRGGWVYGWRTRRSQHVGSTEYLPGNYEAPWFSTAPTVCHPGLYVAGPEYMNQEYPRVEWVRVRFRRSDCHEAGGKYRVRRFTVLP